MVCVTVDQVDPLLFNFVAVPLDLKRMRIAPRKESLLPVVHHCEKLRGHGDFAGGLIGNTHCGYDVVTTNRVFH